MKLVREPPDSMTPLLHDDTFPGHRVATQYLLSALEGHIPPAHLLQYRAANSKLPGHPELGLTPGVKFSSGRLGHLWPMINGIALANRDKTIFCLGSDGSQQEGNDAEAARLAVAQNLNVKIIIDDNNVTIAGHPSEYLKGYDLEKTLAGHGLEVVTVQGEDIDALWAAFSKIVTHQGPAASESKYILLSFVISSDTGNQLFASASWPPGFRISKEVRMVTT
jgi:transketolase N-terminal domain/subunit